MVPVEAVISKKGKEVDNIQRGIESSQAVYFLNYKGVSVQSLSEFRSALHEFNARATVYKNTYIRRALDNLKYECPDSVLKEPTAVLMCPDDIVSPAKLIFDFISKNEVGELKGGFLGNKSLDINEVKSLSKLPTRDELIAKVVGTLNAPIHNFVLQLSGVPRSFVYVLNAIKDQKSGGE